MDWSGILFLTVPSGLFIGAAGLQFGYLIGWNSAVTTIHDECNRTGRHAMALRMLAFWRCHPWPLSLLHHCERSETPE